MLEGLKLRTFGKDRDIELACLMDHVMREVKLVNSNADPVRLSRDLGYRVNYAAVVLRTILSRQDKEAVSQIVHGFAVHIIPPFLNA